MTRAFANLVNANIQVEAKRLEYQGALLQLNPLKVRSMLLNYLTEFSADTFYQAIKRAQDCVDEDGLNKPATYALLGELNPQ